MLLQSILGSPARCNRALEVRRQPGPVDRVAPFSDEDDAVRSIPPADIVTLDRVLNVYPDWERLGFMAAERTRRVLGIVVPRDTPMVRLVVAVMNVVLRLRRQSIRARVIQIEAIERMARRAGLARTYSHAVGAWQVLAYRRIPDHA